MINADGEWGVARSLTVYAASKAIESRKSNLRARKKFSIENKSRDEALPCAGYLYHVRLDYKLATIAAFIHSRVERQ